MPPPAGVVACWLLALFCPPAPAGLSVSAGNLRPLTAILGSHLPRSGTLCPRHLLQYHRSAPRIMSSRVAHREPLCRAHVHHCSLGLSVSPAPVPASVLSFVPGLMAMLSSPSLGEEAGPGSLSYVLEVLASEQAAAALAPALSAALPAFAAPPVWPAQAAWCHPSSWPVGGRLVPCSLRSYGSCCH